MDGGLPGCEPWRVSVGGVASGSRPYHRFPEVARQRDPLTWPTAYIKSDPKTTRDHEELALANREAKPMRMAGRKNCST
jgi:hypothetical protein